MEQWAISTFTSICEIAVPIAIVFNLGMLIVSTFMRVAFGGRLWFGK